jgi:hypothetical protein
MRVEDCPPDESGNPYGVPSTVLACERCGADIWRSISILALDEAMDGVYVCNQCAPAYVEEHS